MAPFVAFVLIMGVIKLLFSRTSRVCKYDLTAAINFCQFYYISFTINQNEINT